MSSAKTIRRTVLRSFVAIAGAALLANLIWRAGPANLLRGIHQLGWGIALIISLGGVAHLVKTAAWRLTLTRGGGRVSFPRLVQLRLASEAIGQLGALGQIFGDGVRVSAMGSSIPLDDRISSVTLDRAMFILSGAMVSLAGIVAASFAMSLSRSLRLYASFFAVILLGLLFAITWAFLNRWPLVSGPARFLLRLRILQPRIDRILPVIRSVERRIYDFRRCSPAAFWSSLVLNFVCHCMAVLEIYLVLRLMGVGIGVLGALVFEALTKLVNAVGWLNPGNIGTYEGGNLLIARMLGLTSTVGLMVAVARRLRAIFWTAVGGVCLFLLSRTNVRRGSQSSQTRLIAKNIPLATKGQEISKPFAAIIFANTIHGVGEVESTLVRIGTLPILLRTILSLQKAHVGRTIVCVDPLTRRAVETGLLDTGRLPKSVEWLETSPDLHLIQLLELFQYLSNDNRLLLIEGSRSYHPVVFKTAMDRTEKDGPLFLTTDGKPVGICVLPENFALDFYCRPSSDVRNLHQFYEFLKRIHTVNCESIDESLWQLVLKPEDRIAAEEKLNCWLIKPTDGIFARMNRKVSVPISRKLIEFPVTPNMVSICTLGVGIVSAAFFACGGYWNMLVGAVLSVWASILDGCDGEVARLKLLESEFGCWLETVCDYLYYLFIFIGMAIGLMRMTGNKAYLGWGALLIVGAVLSFVVAGLGRHRMTAGRPEQYLGIWQKKAESRRSNPILYIGRHTEFLIRRCFLPYALLGFALVNLTQVAFFLTSIGANLVWIVSLYSFFTFSLFQKSSINRSSAAVGTPF